MRIDRPKIRKDSIKLWISLIILCAITMWVNKAHAGDYHQRTQGHAVTYVITDTSGKPVSGQTVTLQVERVRDGLILDHNDNTFKSSGWTTRYATMNYDPKIESYIRVISIDSSILVSGDYICMVSNDNATYSDHQAETVSFDTLGDIIKINR